MPRTDASRVILELVRCASGMWDGRTKLSLAFYFAHLYYFDQTPGLLTDWPIIRTPQGPGIERLPDLLQGLIEEGFLTIEAVREGPFSEQRFLQTSKSPAPALPEDAAVAIKDAADYVRSRTAAELSHVIQERSRSWRLAQDGDVLDVYTDLIPEEDHERLEKEIQELSQIVEAVLDESSSVAERGRK